MKISIVIILLLIVSWSCTKTLDFEEAETDQQIVINSIISPDSSFSAVILRSRSVLFDHPYILVPNVPLNLYEDGSLIREISSENGFYRIPDFKPQAGKTYRLATQVDGKELEATTSIPQKVEIVSVDTTTVQDEWGYGQLNFKITFDDPETEDYYRLVVMRDVLSKSTWGDSIVYYRNYSQVGFDTDDPVFKTLYNNFGDNEMDMGPYNRYNLFSDVNFNGREHSIQFNVSSFYGGYQDVVYNKYEIHLLKMSEEFFNYLKYLNLYDYYSDDPFSEPVPVYSNVKNGTGIFCGYNDEAKLTYEKVYIPYSMDTIHPVDNGYSSYGYY